MQTVEAQLNYLRMPPRKVRLVANLIKGMHVFRAESQLRFVGKRAARPVLKLLKSAIANAEHNFRIEKKNLFVQSVTVDGGPVLKRGRARAFGRSAPIMKRTSHITLVLGVREGSAVPEVHVPRVSKPKEREALTERDSSDTMKRRASMRESVKQPKKQKGFVQRMFQRKAI
ncbi:MAG: 50S ribosomal protein L22 [Candidatus Sungbacteria bacterium]|nr:50S ribosomal protein L22 [Candidatus Sungbacteria bacterium]